ncbi:MAG: hypothetical protein ACYSWQ_11485 [Planctomycetota bacterium]
MKPITYYPRNGGLMLAMTMLALLALGLSGCVRSTGIQILPVGNQDVLDLTAADVVQVMKAAGFSEVQIYEHGTAVRDGIARSGAVQVKIDDTIEAVFAAKGDTIYVSTRSRGHFYYNVNTGWPQPLR